jgi:hypothetical protein
MADGPWFAPELSLSSQMEMEIDRRAAARMSRDELSIKADELIQAWYQHREAIQRASREIAGLQCKLALAEHALHAREESAIGLSTTSGRRRC